MSKEILLIIAALLSVVVIYFTFLKMNTLTLSKSKRLGYICITLLMPILGFILVSINKQK